MPIVKRSSYTRRPFYMLNGHMETIIPSMFFKVQGKPYKRERLELGDGDFLDLDWLREGSTRLLILSHGLEGSSDRYYVRRTASYFHDLGWDILAWNCRSCSGEMNRLPRFYHHGDTDDLASVVDHALQTADYTNAVLMGYSMGGSMSIKYLGESRERDDRIRGAVTFSVPVNLKDSAVQIERRENRIYEKRFLGKLKEKITMKAKMFPDQVSAQGLDQLSDFETFHERYTVPLHNFSDIDDFYDKATCDKYLDQISKPVLIANASNDPMLGDACYPQEMASHLSHIHLEIPRYGGHVGFSIHGSPYSWMEVRAEEFINRHLDV